MSPFARTSTACLALICVSFPGTQACGPWLPNRYLERGGGLVREAPEFFFELELKQLAKDFPTPFKVAVPKKTKQADDDRAFPDPKGQTDAADLADFEAALAAKKTAPSEGAVARSQHLAARAALRSQSPPDHLPDELRGEFADYHRGALAFFRKDAEAAQTTWTQLLALPAPERHYRSTWAAFMLGKLALEAKQPDESVKWFEKVRELAGQGFADSLGLASSSLGWQARAELSRDGLEAAAGLYLQHLASGDLSAVESLVAVAQTATEEGRELARAAADAGLQRIVTAYILTRAMPPGNARADDAKPSAEDISMRWAAALEKGGAERVEDAERLGWAAYSEGHFDEAARWLKRARPGTGLGLWLEAKLAFRAGRLKAATDALAKALPLLPQVQELEASPLVEHPEMRLGRAAGDLGLMQLARGEFLSAFLAFDSGGLWADEAFIAERVLTIEELLQTVRKGFPWSVENDVQTVLIEQRSYDGDDDELYRDWLERTHTGESQFAVPAEIRTALKIRWLLARRLTRLGRYAEARPFFPRQMRARLDEFATAHRRGGDAKLSAAARAAALWQAAQITRRDGMELLGTELEPDGFIWNGDYKIDDVRAERLAGKFTATRWETVQRDGFQHMEARHETKPLAVPVTPSERARLLRNRVQPDTRFHYRFLAADLAWRAAKLMPDNSEETARVLNTAGRWLAARHEDAAERFYQALESRCAKTDLGRAAIKIHWFPAPPEGAESDQKPDGK